MKSTLSFLKEGLMNMRTTGSIVRSSKHLVKEMLKPIDFKNAKIIVELGAGDGVLTKEILSQMQPDARLLCFEINPEFCKLLKEIDDKRFILIEDSAETLHACLQEMNIKEVDYVISGIPFVTLPDDLSYSIVRGCHKSLKKAGLYIQFHYSTLIKEMYQRIFGNVDINFVARNLPPAFVMICIKQ